MRLVNRSIFNLPSVIILILLFLANMNVGNLFFYFLFGAFLISVLANMRGVLTDVWTVGLFLFSLCYILFLPGRSNSITLLLKQFSYPLCYIVGLNFIKYDEGDITNNRQKERLLSVAFVIPALGSFVHYLLNMVINISSLTRNTVDIWTGEMMAATGQASLAVMAIGAFSAWLFSEVSKIVKILAAIGLVFVFAYNFVLAGRTLILLSAMILGIAFIYAIKISRIQRKGKIFFVTVLAIFVALVIYTQNIFGVRDWILESNLLARFDTILIGEDTRMDNKRLYIKYMLSYPFGGDALRSKVGGYAHELYLDVYNDVGIIGYFLVSLFVVDSSVKAWKIVKRDTIGSEFKLLLLCLYVAILAEFFLEPIIRSIPWLFCTFCFYSGLLKRRLQSEK